MRMIAEILSTREGLGQRASDATFFSRSSRSLRSAFDLSSSRTRFMSRRFSSIFSVFFPTCSNMPSNLFCIPGIASRTGLISERMDSISTPTSVAVNLSFFLPCFFMGNIIIKKELSVKQIISRETREGTGRRKNSGLGLFFQHRAMNFNIGTGTTVPGEKLEVAGNLKFGVNDAEVHHDRG